FSLLFIPFLMFLLICSSLIPFLSLKVSEVVLPIHTGILEWLENNSGFLNIQWVVGEIDVSFIIVYLVTFCLMMMLWIKQKHAFAFLAGLLSVCVIISFCLLPYFSSNGRVIMLDVGQGDTFVIELPYRRGVIMIDAAGPPVFTENDAKIAENIILPYLKSRGISWLDTIIVSHKDTDHSGSVNFLLEELSVENLMISPFDPLEIGGEKVVRVQGGESVNVAGQTFSILHPMEDSGNANDNSIVVKFSLGGLDWLFTGDASVEIEKKLLRKGTDVKADVLKVGHHGSKTSTSKEWLENVSPSFALISAGQDNRYGHPHHEVVEKLSAEGIMFLQTPEHGAVQYDFSNESGTFSVFVPYNASRE
ncbi:DNA internalization-related competence protein ComEC/Rec2, partial [Halobacillus sp. BBL2006]|uniref:DNA internalization-related competence protein ComEC/Rec2 n=1 Tax=Halobacillus sp. BBL2006 TaxID=1543706 RepID=UPI00054266FC